MYVSDFIYIFIQVFKQKKNTYKDSICIVYQKRKQMTTVLNSNKKYHFNSYEHLLNYT